MAAPNRFAWAYLAAWLVTAAEVSRRLDDSAFEIWLAAIAVIGIAGGVLWLRRGWRWRAVVLVATTAYLVHYALRMYVLEVEPLLAIVSLPQAVADAVYVMWSSPMGRMSRGEVLDGLVQVWREWLMPLLQLSVLLAGRRLS